MSNTPRELNIRVKIKKDTTANWNRNRVLPYDGEFIIYADSDQPLRLKIGDGSNTPSNLDFLFDNITENEINNLFQ